MGLMDETGAIAAVYLRISQDRTGEHAGVQRQQEDCLALAAQLGHENPLIFIDNDVSAFDGGRRPGYDSLVSHVRTGATIIIVWHVDRLYRQPKELEDLIDLVEQHPVRIETVRGGGFDLNTHEGRLMARQLVAIAAYGSGHKSDRVKRANKRLAEQGRWHGPARYGYGPGGVLIPEQAAVVREMADRFLAGESLRSLTRWLNTSQIPPQRASDGTVGIWYPYTVRSVLASARISGQRAYAPDTRSDPTGGREILGPGTWEAIITPAETARIREILTDPARRRLTPAVPSLLGGIAKCGKCGAGLTIARHHTKHGAADSTRYRCLKDPSRPERGGLSINADQLDALIVERVLHRLAHPHPSAKDGTVRSLLAQIVAINGRIADLRDDALRFRDLEVRAGIETASQLLIAVGRQLSALTNTHLLNDAPIGDPTALKLWWEELAVPEQREVITALIARLRIAPGHPGSRFDRKRAQITYRK